MSLSRAVSSRYVLLFAVALFLVTRVGMLQRFPIFNDEAIYLQYSQFIHANWAKNKFISMNYTYGDWKPPLQYWMTAPFITWGDDPLIVGRAVAVLVSFAGLFGFYLFTRELFSKVEGAITAVLYALCPTVLFHNDQFVAETFLFSTAPFVYWTLLNALRGGRRTWAWMVAATLIGAALLLFKQSGSLLLLGAIALPLAQRPIAPGRARPSSVLRAFVIVALVMIGAEMIAALFQPAAYNATKARFNSNWVMSAPELVRFPIAVWRSNLQVVADYITSYYSWLVVAFVVAFVWLALRRKRLNELVLALLCLSSGASVCLLLRGFNEYIVNTAIIVTLLPILSRMAVLLWNLYPARTTRLLRPAALGFGAALLLFWSYQIVLMQASPARYLARSTRWAVSNYLNGRSSGFGIPEIVNLLGQEKRRGVIFADAQWGHPRTALEVYNRQRFPNLAILPALREFPDPNDLPKFVEMARQQYAVRLAIYSSDPASGRGAWERRVDEEICRERREIKTVPSQMPLVVCDF